jgi:hypothetical protein
MAPYLGLEEPGRSTKQKWKVKGRTEEEKEEKEKEKEESRKGKEKESDEEEFEVEDILDVRTRRGVVECTLSSGRGTPRSIVHGNQRNTSATHLIFWLGLKREGLARQHRKG